MERIKVDCNSREFPQLLEQLRSAAGALLLVRAGTLDARERVVNDIARFLGRTVQRLELKSLVVGKYIGETEKNLARLLDEAEEAGVILLFDEADALFGKRTAVADSHDRYGNVETSYLLERLATHHGIAIFAADRAVSVPPEVLKHLRWIVDCGPALPGRT